MFQISKTQVSELSHRLMLNYQRELTQHCRSKFPHISGRLSEDELAVAVEETVQCAQKLGFETMDGIRIITEYRMLFGAEFHNDPLHPWTAEAIHVPDVVTEGRRIRKLFDAANDHLGRVHAEENNGPNVVIEALHRTFSRDVFEIGRENGRLDIQRLLIQQFHSLAEVIGAQPFATLVDEAVNVAREHSFESRDDAAFLALTMATFGHGCLVDPALPQLRKATGEHGAPGLRSAVRKLLAARPGGPS